jgi:predicted nucleic acid-binding protein
MKVFLDTNILIDFIARRENFYQASANLINLGIKGEVELYTTPLTYATCVFIAKKVLGYEGAVKAMQILDNYLNVTTMDGSQCHNALFSSMPDFEDMLQFESAYAAGCDVIVTRNKKHFPHDAIQVLDTLEFFDSYWSEES